ncbi:MAG: hypothetical protein IPK64_21865 [bacterium]|nr:hypothetical protein [bacterium]
MAGDFDGDGTADLAGLTANGGIYYSTDFVRWQNIPGMLVRLVAGDFDGDGQADLAGLAGNGGVYYSTSFTNWVYATGVLANLAGSSE